MFPLHGQKNYNGSQQEPKLFGYQYDLKYLLFVSQKKVIQVWNGMILNTILSFVWNILRIFFFLKNKHFVIIYTPLCHSKPDIVKKVFVFVHILNVKGIKCCLNPNVFLVFHRRKKCRFVMTWRYINNDRIFIFGWTTPKNKGDKGGFSGWCKRRTIQTNVE